MGRIKTNYPKRFVLFSLVYFILFSVFVALRGFQMVSFDIKLLIVTIFILYFNYIDLKVSKSFHISFNIPVMFFIFLLYPIRFILPYSFILVFIIFFVRKIMQKRNFADAFIITFFLSGIQSTYVLIGLYVFRGVYPHQFLHVGVIQIFALLCAFLAMAVSDFIIYLFTNKILLQNNFTKNDFVVVFYSTLSDLVLFILFLMLYVLYVNNRYGIALFYIFAVFVLIKIFYKILSVRLEIFIYADLLKRLNNLQYNIDDYSSIEKALLDYFKTIKSDLYLENVYFYRRTYEDILEITPDDKKIFRYLVPEVHSKCKKMCDLCEIKKGKIKHYPFEILYLRKEHAEKETGGMLISLLIRRNSPYLSNYLKILFNRFNGIIDLHVDRDENRELLGNIISILVSSIEGSDKETVTHSKRVAIIASKIAAILGYPENKVELFKYAGLLHDVGIVTYSRSIYAKKSKTELTEDEWNMIKEHPVIGYNVLKNIRSLGEVPQWILEHHERFDGKGFPYGKKGDEISRGGMILNLANVFDSFLFGKTYMNKVTVNMAIKYIIKGRGTIFDPDLIDRVAPHLEEIAKDLIKQSIVK